MARAKKGDTAHRPLLALWAPPAAAGSPVGVLATTFTLDTALFEEECLARFAGVQSDPMRDGALYRIEREERLADLLCAAVVADVRHCGGLRSLRWDLLAARPASGVMHAKISLLAWSDHVRVLVGSANLTNEGYRRNQECVATLDFTEVQTDRSLLDPLLDFLRELLALTAGPGRARAEQLLDWVHRRLPRHDPPTRGLRRHLLLVGPGRDDLFSQIKGATPAGAPPGEVHVVSPFFDPGLRDTGPERKVWELMKQRGSASLHFHVAGEEAEGTGRWRLEAPAHLLAATPKGRPGVSTDLHAVRVTDVATDFGLERRPLHAKILALQHETWSALLVGSSNFTSAGTGLSPYARNFEANVLYFVRAPEADGARKAMEQRRLQGGAAVPRTDDIDFEPAIDPDTPGENTAPPLPSFFAEATLNAAGDDGYELALTLAPPAPAGDWAVRHGDVVIVEQQSWSAQGRPMVISSTLPRHGPPPSMLEVRWGDSTHTAAWPINVRTADALPAPAELQGLSLAALLDLLSSARPLHEALRAWMRRLPDDDDADVEQAVELVDPHAKVDTSGFLIKRVQRACWALLQLRKRLEEPLLSSAAMAWRINGPVGARSVLAAMARQSDPKLPDEWAFLLCEMRRELSQVKLQPVGHQPLPEDATVVLAGLLDEIDESLERALPACSEAMRSFVAASLREETDATA